MRTVLVTRPQPAADRTAQRLAQMGLAPVVAPLSRTLPLSPVLPGGPFDAVTVTSAAAFRHLPRTIADPLKDLPCMCVGPATATAAREAGFSDVHAADGDAVSLGDYLVRRTDRHARILYLAGRLRTERLEALLAAAGRAPVVLEVYDTVMRAPDAAERQGILEAGAIDAVLLYSSVAARAFAALARDAALAPCFERSRLLCISSRVAEAAGRWHGGIDIAERPHEPGLLALLRPPSFLPSDLC